jgi:ferredoxin--NADP+ reductase
MIMDRANYSSAELVERVDFAADHALMRFKLDTTFSFVPGQYATIAVQDGDKLIARPYSIVSAPHEPLLEFFIELVPNGALTPRLWALKKGDHALIRNRMAGKFVRAEEDAVTNHLMIATVTGAAPFISMARALAAEMKRGKPAVHRLYILHGASHSSELGTYKDELTQLARDGWLHYVPTVSRPWEDPQWKGETGRVEELIRKYLDRLNLQPDTTFAYVCGHPQMIENAKGILQRARFPVKRIKEEVFFRLDDDASPRSGRNQP